jgi:hypothetical protein
MPGRTDLVEQAGLLTVSCKPYERLGDSPNPYEQILPPRLYVSLIRILTVKTLWKMLLLTLVLCLPACAGRQAAPSATAAVIEQAAETPAPAPAANSKPVLKTTIGEFVIDSARWVDEVNGVTPGEGEKILLVILTQPGLERLDPEQFSLEAFDKAIHDVSNGEIHISGDDGSTTISTMAGWVGEKHDEFAMGFRLPITAKTYQLFWPGNEPVDIIPIH